MVDGPRVYDKAGSGAKLLHDGVYGAYLDAMGDKAFGVCALLVLLCLDGLPLWWKAIAVLKLPLHVALAVLRRQDYMAKLRGETKVGLPAQGLGVGKFATCSENFGCAVAALTLGAVPLGAVAGTAALCVTGVLSLLSIDMAMRSLSHKLRARCQETPLVGGASTAAKIAEAQAEKEKKAGSKSTVSTSEGDDELVYVHEYGDANK